ncbi:hypothetical protein B0T17DRAFT_258844 [Bombardia bombarda]|uniref:SHSP domain-containing protein n=1 Tax=Bombardia bombarda TaxID=252184 RepID=A0AA39X116_9PEZI|nr:hypothetical protein B0T17DRAFT_258844 [Bombardia bombarda]
MEINIPAYRSHFNLFPPRWEHAIPHHHGATTTTIPYMAEGTPPTTVVMAKQAAAMNRLSQLYQSYHRNTNNNSNDNDGNQHHPIRLGLDTLAHLLHTFHTHYHTGHDDNDNENENDHQEIAHPRFDLIESMTCYTLYGELPSLDRDDVMLETNDRLFTVTISGVFKQSAPVPGSTPSASFVPPKPSTLGSDEAPVGVVHCAFSQPAMTETQSGRLKGATGEIDRVKLADLNYSNRSLRQEGKREGADERDTVDAAGSEEGVHWHVAERQVGEFSRTFQFPVDMVDMAAVKASMQNGLLCVVVPKKEGDHERARRGRKVEIGSGLGEKERAGG